MTHKPTRGQKSMTPCVSRGKATQEKDKAGEVRFDARALRLNESAVANGNHDAVMRAVTGEYS